MKVVFNRSDIEQLVKEHMEAKYPDLPYEIEWSSEETPKQPLKRAPRALKKKLDESPNQEEKEAPEASEEHSDEEAKEEKPIRSLFNRGA